MNSNVDYIKIRVTCGGSVYDAGAFNIVFKNGVYRGIKATSGINYDELTKISSDENHFLRCAMKEWCEKKLKVGDVIPFNKQIVEKRARELDSLKARELERLLKENKELKHKINSDILLIMDEYIKE